VALEVKCSETFPFELVFLASAMSVIVVNSVNLVKDKQMSMQKTLFFSLTLRQNKLGRSSQESSFRFVQY